MFAVRFGAGQIAKTDTVVRSTCNIPPQTTGRLRSTHWAPLVYEYSNLQYFMFISIFASGCVFVSCIVAKVHPPSSAIHCRVERLYCCGESGTSEAVISVMCFSSWMDGGKDRSMDGWACSIVTVWLQWPCTYHCELPGHTSGRACVPTHTHTCRERERYQSGWPPQAGRIQQQ